MSLAVTAYPVTDSSQGLVAQVITGLAGVTIVSGNSLYQDTSSTTPLYKLCAVNVSANSTSAALAGIALNNALANQPVNFAVGGDITFAGDTAPFGTAIIVDSVAGGIRAATAIGTQVYPSLVGLMVSSNQCRLAITTNNGTYATA